MHFASEIFYANFCLHQRVTFVEISIPTHHKDALKGNLTSVLLAWHAENCWQTLEMRTCPFSIRTWFEHPSAPGGHRRIVRHWAFVRAFLHVKHLRPATKRMMQVRPVDHIAKSFLIKRGYSNFAAISCEWSRFHANAYYHLAFIKILHPSFYAKHSPVPLLQVTKLKIFQQTLQEVVFAF